MDDLLHGHRYAKAAIDIAAPDPPPSIEELRNCPRRRQVREAVRRLPLFLRRPVRLHYYQGRSLREVARRLETSVNGIKSRLYRARHILKKEAQ